MQNRTRFVWGAVGAASIALMGFAGWWVGHLGTGTPDAVSFVDDTTPTVASPAVLATPAAPPVADNAPQVQGIRTNIGSKVDQANGGQLTIQIVNGGLPRAVDGNGNEVPVVISANNGRVSMGQQGGAALSARSFKLKNAVITADGNTVIFTETNSDSTAHTMTAPSIIISPSGTPSPSLR